MAILIDPPRWPAHGTVFSHLVSDSSLEELHAFARAAGLPSRAFDHDHYDVPQARYDDLVAAGALPVRERDLVRRLIDSGLRVRKADKTPTRDAALDAAARDWARYDLPEGLRDDLLGRWREPHRHYHDVRHLAACLAALDDLGATQRPVRLAAWFHDAVYEGVHGSDEERSAALAEERLAGLLDAAEAAEVARLVRMTAEHRPTDAPSKLLSDADLSVLGQSPGRYHVYLRDVRLDYAHLDDETWRSGRRTVVQALLAADPLFHTQQGSALWAEAASRNLADELAGLT
ncbi:hypothetical protein BW730_12295 [Tessaracoccus aquimaris]|uniref:DUF4031 domain-containing protein n=1 Tax=Tessaracoccus aquimaris TaxID=1332264 RepID=A0A1Q2CQ53_9ACTN|nr:DUF4031 domain-containing protein [Tessaracoccus aquimaris]AQP48160.1 hypothetical protein BW730_12295 [Tessaracoccus aquimaris]